MGSWHIAPRHAPWLPLCAMRRALLPCRSVNAQSALFVRHAPCATRGFQCLFADAPRAGDAMTSLTYY
jgi:hypothetical protein